MIIKLVKFGEILISRPAGREAFLAMSAYVTRDLPADEEITVDFAGVKVLAPSWADEVISKLAETRKLKFLNTENSSVKATLKTLAEYSGLDIG